MTITKIQTITNIFTEENVLQSTSTVDSYILTPAKGKVLKNIKTNEIISTKICVTRKAKISNYIEVEDPNALK